MDKFDSEEIFNNMLYMPDKEAADRAEKLLDDKRAEGDSVGGVVECVVSGMKAGSGEPVFEKLDANLAKAIVSIGAVKAFEVGDGTKVAKSFGSGNNDDFIADDNGNITKLTNHAG